MCPDDAGVMVCDIVYNTTRTSTAKWWPTSKGALERCRPRKRVLQAPALAQVRRAGARAGELDSGPSGRPPSGWSKESSLLGILHHQKRPATWMRLRGEGVVVEEAVFSRKKGQQGGGGGERRGRETCILLSRFRPLSGLVFSTLASSLFRSAPPPSSLSLCALWPLRRSLQHNVPSACWCLHGPRPPASCRPWRPRGEPWRPSTSRRLTCFGFVAG